jgi:hypothetical protein
MHIHPIFFLFSSSTTLSGRGRTYTNNFCHVTTQMPSASMATDCEILFMFDHSSTSIPFFYLNPFLSLRLWSVAVTLRCASIGVLLVLPASNAQLQLLYSFLHSLVLPANVHVSVNYLRIVLYC